MESIPECLTDEETLDNEYCEITFYEKPKNVIVEEKKEKLGSSLEPNSTENANCVKYKNTHFPPSEYEADILEKESLSNKKIERYFVPLTDISKSDLKTDNTSLEIDKDSPYSNITPPEQKITSKHSNVGISKPDADYETFLCQPPNVSDSVSAAEKKNECLDDSKNQYVKLDKNSESISLKFCFDKRNSVLESIPPSLPSNSRQRSGSVQWIQNAFHNVEQKWRDFVDLRRPSDIVEQRMRKSNETIEMDISEEESSRFGSSSANGGRRYSENVIEKRRFPFSSGFVHLKDLWRDRNTNRRHENKDIDQTRPDVCPLFNIPKNVDEDELILDSLRQAMRKCTAIDPTSRPTSASVLEQLAQLSK